MYISSTTSAVTIVACEYAVLNGRRVFDAGAEDGPPSEVALRRAASHPGHVSGAGVRAAEYCCAEVQGAGPNSIVVTFAFSTVPPVVTHPTLRKAGNCVLTRKSISGYSAPVPCPISPMCFTSTQPFCRPQIDVLYSLGFTSAGENQVNAFSDPTTFKQVDVVNVSVSDYMRCSKKGPENWYAELELRSGTRLRYHSWDKPSTAKAVVAEMQGFFATEGKKPDFMRKLPDFSRSDQVWKTLVLLLWVGVFGAVLLKLVTGGYRETVHIDTQTKEITVTEESVLGLTTARLAVGFDRGVRLCEVKHKHVLNKNKFDKKKIHQMRYGIELVYSDTALVVDKDDGEEASPKWKHKRLAMGDLIPSQDANEYLRKQMQDVLDGAQKKAS